MLLTLEKARQTGNVHQMLL